MTNTPKCGHSLNGRTNEQMDEQTDRRTVRFYYAPNFIWGHNKDHKLSKRVTQELTVARVKHAITQCEHVVKPHSKMLSIIIKSEDVSKQ